MYSTEKLICEVQNYPCLWDMSSKEYSDRDLKNSCWIKVAEAVYSTEWTNFETTKKEEKVKELKNKKWRHIRDAYMKYMSEEKNVRSGSEGTKKKPYAYAEVLSFLNTTVKKRKTTGNIDVLEDDAEHSSDENEDDVHNVSSPSEPQKSHQKLNKKARITPFQSSLIDHLNKQNERESDLDRNIVLSFLPYVKQLNDEEKLNFQIYGLNYLKNIIQNKTISSQSGQQINQTYSRQFPESQIPLSNFQYPSSSSMTNPLYSYPYQPYPQPNNYFSQNPPTSHTDLSTNNQQLTSFSKPSTSDNSPSFT